MNKQEIIFWRNRYNEEEDRYVSGLEEKLRKKFQKNRFITKKDLQEIIKWKFQGQLKGRQLLNLERLTIFNSAVIEKISKLAFEVNLDKLRIRLLVVIDGVGPAVASVILTFYDPDNYGVLDFHAWNVIFKNSKKIFTEKDCLEYFNELRKISKKLKLPCRDIEKALFKKDLEKSKNY